MIEHACWVQGYLGPPVVWPRTDCRVGAGLGPRPCAWRRRRPSCRDAGAASASARVAAAADPHARPPLIMDSGGDPQNRFDPPRRGEHAGISAAMIFQAWLKNTEGSIYDRAIPSSKPIPVTLARWSQWHGSRAVSSKRLTWLFQLIGVPCLDVGFLPPGQTTPPPDRDGCDEYLMFDAQSGAGVGGFVTRSGAAVLRSP